MTDPVAVELLALIPTGSATGMAKPYDGARGLADLLGDLFVDVKSCGALGDGNQDDTQYIQKAIELAFGTSASPHGNNVYLNRPLYFPPGNYKVSCPTGVLTVSNVTVSGNPGTYTYTLDSVDGISNGDTVYIDSVTMSNGTATQYGNGTRRVNVNVGAKTITTVDSYASGTTATYSSGGNVRTAALKTWGVGDGKIFGAHRGSTTITNTTVGGITFQTDGFIYSKIDGIRFAGAGGAGSIALLLDMRGRDIYVGAQGNEISNCEFGGADILVELFPTQTSQGSENIFFNCFWQGANTSTIGLRVGLNSNANALQNQIISGNFQSLTTTCVHVLWGSIPNICGVGFQSNDNPSAWGIVINNSSWDVPVIYGCRVEMANFINAIHSSPVVLGCNQTSDAAGTFAVLANGGSLINCTSKNGIAQMVNGGNIIECQFGRSITSNDWVYPFTNAPIYVRDTQVGNLWNGGGQDTNTTILGDGVVNMDGAGVVKFVGSKVGFWDEFRSSVTYQTMAVADLPTPSAIWKGHVCTVRDSSVTTYGLPVAASGSAQVLVFCNGTNWVVVGA